MSEAAHESRCLPEFVFDPQLGEAYHEALSLKGNKNPTGDWWLTKYSDTEEKYAYTIALSCCTEARFRQHIKRRSPKRSKKWGTSKTCSSA